jgi:hypothetical protein
MYKSQSLFYLTTALHVSGVTITHLQEHKTTVTTTSGNRYTVLLSAAIVEDFELIGVYCGWRKPAVLLVVSGRPARPRPTALLSPSSDGKPEAATAVVASDDGHEDARNMLSCI